MATLLRVDGTRMKLADAELPTLQLAVGGYVEAITLPLGVVMFVNEDAINLGLPINPTATALCVGRASMAGGIRGDVVLCDAKEVK
jgi:hypothetical protein